MQQQPGCRLRAGAQGQLGALEPISSLLEPSLPDFDPGKRRGCNTDDRLGRPTVGLRDRDRVDAPLPGHDERAAKACEETEMGKAAGLAVRRSDPPGELEPLLQMIFRLLVPRRPEL